jgi:hypothetical protein
MKAKRQIESSLNSVMMLDGSGGHVSAAARHCRIPPCSLARELARKT